VNWPKSIVFDSWVVGGAETYAVSLVRSMTSEFPDDDFIVCLNQETSNPTLGEIKNLHMNETCETIPPK
jgi:hypothetical protein